MGLRAGAGVTHGGAIAPQEVVDEIGEVENVVIAVDPVAVEPSQLGIRNLRVVPAFGGVFGIGLGVDYAIYMMDRIKEEMHVADSLQHAITRAVSTTGVAIAITATTLIGGIIMWVFVSDLRFQADAARLLLIMLVLNAAAAMFVVPAWVDVFKPKFIMQAAEERWELGRGSTIDEVVG